MPGAGRRILRPSHAGVETPDPSRQGLFVLVEQRELVVAGDIVLDIAVGVEDRDRLAPPRIAIAARGHPVADVVGQEPEPLVEPPLIQQARLAIEELLDLAGDVLVHSAALDGDLRYGSAAQSSAAITLAQCP